MSCGVEGAKKGSEGRCGTTDPRTLGNANAHRHPSDLLDELQMVALLGRFLGGPHLVLRAVLLEYFLVNFLDVLR